MTLRTVVAILATLTCSPALAASPVEESAQTAEVVRLREAFLREVRNAIPPDSARDKAWVALARAALVESDATIDHPQLVVVVDRNPRVQQLVIVAASPVDAWQVIGGGAISTGQTGRFDHYVTPTGVFRMTDAILGYRAEGTLNENGIRGLGAKGMRVWDFGWHVAKKGWAETIGKPETTPIRFMLHATDPDKLERRLGRPASQGCIRMPATLNRFIDRHGVIDADYERAAATDIRFRALLLSDRQPSSIAGDTLIVVDSSPPGPPPALQAAVKAAPVLPRPGAIIPIAAPGRS